MTDEYILCAAIHYEDIKIRKNVMNVDGVVICGHRHPNCIATMNDLTGLRTVQKGENSVGKFTQGFLTNKNRFVDRQEGYEIAYNAGQLKTQKSIKTLYSEDLY